MINFETPKRVEARIESIMVYLHEYCTEQNVPIEGKRYAAVYAGLVEAFDTGMDVATKAANARAIAPPIELKVKEPSIDDIVVDVKLAKRKAKRKAVKRRKR